MVTEKDVAVEKEEEVVSVSNKVEKTVEDLTIEPITSKDALEASHVAHLVKKSILQNILSPLHDLCHIKRTSLHSITASICNKSYLCTLKKQSLKNLQHFYSQITIRIIYLNAKLNSCRLCQKKTSLH